MRGVRVCPVDGLRLRKIYEARRRRGDSVVRAELYACRRGHLYLAVTVYRGGRPVEAYFDSFDPARPPNILGEDLAGELGEAARVAARV